jgi:hypothetical protein
MASPSRPWDVLEVLSFGVLPQPGSAATAPAKQTTDKQVRMREKERLGLLRAAEMAAEDETVVERMVTSF